MFARFLKHVSKKPFCMDVTISRGFVHIHWNREANKLFKSLQNKFLNLMFVGNNLRWPILYHFNVIVKKMFSVNGVDHWWSLTENRSDYGIYYCYGTLANCFLLICSKFAVELPFLWNCKKMIHLNYRLNQEITLEFILAMILRW